MHCRGLLEEMLQEVFFAKQVKGNFNATYVCDLLGTGEKNDKYERVLVIAAEKIMCKYVNGDLN